MSQNAHLVSVPEDPPPRPHQAGGFSPCARVVVEQLDDKEWKIREAFRYRGAEDTFTVYEGMRTDFASVPRIFVWLLPRYGRYTKAALVHDLLWREYAKQGRIDWVEADGVFRRAMRELDVPFLRRWMMWAAVRWAALLQPGGRTGWWREAWRVLLVTLVVIPIVVPPALVIAAALILFFLVEAGLWVPLRLIDMVKERLGTGRKQVNAPTFDWKAG